MSHQVIEAGIDYLTLHTPMWSELRPMTPDELISAYLVYISSFGGLQYQTVMGYEGNGDNFFFVGVREDGWLRRIAGSAAHVLFDSTFVTGDRPSRLDIQITVRLDGSVNEVIEAHRIEAQIASELLPKGRQRKIEQHSDNRGGMTVYVGSRHSDAFGRIYNKYAKTPEDRYNSAVRYEIELHGDSARVYAEMLAQAGERRERAILHYVLDWYRARGVVIQVSPTSRDWQPLALQPNRPTEETTLIWFKKQVRPAIERLLRSYPRSRILSELGLLDQTEQPDDPTIER